MKTKANYPRTARSLATTIAIAFFTISVVTLLVNGDDVSVEGEPGNRS